MRFSGEQEVAAPAEKVWTALHDRDVLCSAIPGCEEMVPLHAGVYAATLRARVGPVADTYRGSFSIEDLSPGSELQVRVGASGRCGRLEATLHVALAHGWQPGKTVLRYDAHATVSGWVARLGKASLTVAGAHFTSTFFRDLDLSLRRAGVRRFAPL